MAGRGKASTLPAWMTNGTVAPGSVPGATATTTTILPPPAAVSRFAAPPPAAPSGFRPPGAQTFSAPPSYGAPARPVFSAPPSSFHAPARPAYNAYGVGPSHPPAMAAPAAPSFSAPSAAAFVRPIAPAPAPASAWTAHKAPDGRSYYYNAATKVSTYEKPAELKSAGEKALPECEWAEHKAPDGRAYFYNSAKKTSVWEEPEALKEHKKLLAAAAAGAAAAPGSGGAATTTATPSMHAATSVGAAPAPAGATMMPGAGYAAAPVFGVVPFGIAPLGGGGGGMGGMTIMPQGGGMHGQVPPRGMPPAGFPQYAGGAPMLAGLAQPSFAPPAAGPAAAPAAAPAPAPSNKKSKVEAPKRNWDAATKEECLAAFREMLREREVKPGAKWGDVQGEFVKDHRYNALKSTGDKKQAFAEFQTSRGKEEREEKRRRAVEAREAFLALLAARRDAVTGETTLEAAASALGSDPAWKALEPEQLRAELYEEFRSALFKTERETKRRLTEEREGAFRALLRSMPDVITTSARWADVKHVIAEHPAYLALEKEDRLRLFKEHVLGLEREEEEARRAAEEKARAGQRERRAEFREALRGLAAAGELTVDTRWGEVQEAMRRHAGAAAAAGADGAAPSPDGAATASSPPSSATGVLYTRLAALGAEIDRFRDGPTVADLFGVELEAADRAYRADRRILRDALDDAKLGFALSESCEPGMDFAAWMARLLAADAVLAPRAAAPAAAVAAGGKGEEEEAVARAAAPAPQGPIAALAAARPWHLRLLYTDLHARAVEAAEAAAKRTRRLKERYEELLMDYYYRSDHVEVTWEQAQRDMRSRTAYLDLPPATRQEWWEAYMERLRAKARARKSRREAERRREAEEAAAEGGTAQAAAGSGDEARAEGGGKVAAEAPVPAPAAAVAVSGVADEPEEGEMDAVEMAAAAAAAAAARQGDDEPPADLRNEPEPEAGPSSSADGSSSSAAAAAAAGGAGGATSAQQPSSHAAGAGAAVSHHQHPAEVGTVGEEGGESAGRGGNDDGSQRHGRSRKREREPGDRDTRDRGEDRSASPSRSRSRGGHSHRVQEDRDPGDRDTRDREAGDRDYKRGRRGDSPSDRDYGGGGGGGSTGRRRYEEEEDEGRGSNGHGRSHRREGGGSRSHDRGEWRGSSRG